MSFEDGAWLLVVPLWWNKTVQDGTQDGPPGGPGWSTRPPTICLSQPGRVLPGECVTWYCNDPFARLALVRLSLAGRCSAAGGHCWALLASAGGLAGLCWSLADSRRVMVAGGLAASDGLVDSPPLLVGSPWCLWCL